MNNRKPNTNPKSVEEMIEELKQVIAVQKKDMGNSIDEAEKIKLAYKISGLENGLYLAERVLANQVNPR